MDALGLIDILMNATEAVWGKAINDFADEFRRGKDLRELLPLLKHTDARLVSVGAWIAAEIADERRGREIFAELSVLIDHSDPTVRFEAIKSVSELVKHDEQDVVESLIRCLTDEGAGVRRQALTQICLMPDSVLEGMRGIGVWSTAQLLVQGVHKHQIKEALVSGDLLAQRVAVAGAMRNYGDDDEFIEDLKPSFDEEVLQELDNLPRGKRFI